MKELLGEYELTHSLWQVIFYLETDGSSSFVDIAKYYNIEKPNITRRVHNLEENLIVKAVLSKDRREKIIHLTELGEELYRVCHKIITELEYNVTKGV